MDAGAGCAAPNEAGAGGPAARKPAGRTCRPRSVRERVDGAADAGRFRAAASTVAGNGRATTAAALPAACEAASTALGQPVNL